MSKPTCPTHKTPMQRFVMPGGVVLYTCVCRQLAVMKGGKA